MIPTQIAIVFISCWLKNMCLEYIGLVLFSNVYTYIYKSTQQKIENGKFVIEQKPFQLYYFLTFFPFIVVVIVFPFLFFVFSLQQKLFKKILNNTQKKHFFFIQT